MKFKSRQNSSVATEVNGCSSGRWRLTRKGLKGTFWNDENVLYADLGGGDMGVYIDKNSLNCLLKVCAL